MSSPLRDFLNTRESEIREQQKALKAELRELQIAKSALDSSKDSAKTTVATQTIKEMVREVLAAQPGGLSSAGIQDGIKKQFGRDIERTSLSPQLSRLKEDGELVLEGDVWRTVNHHADLPSKNMAWPSQGNGGDFEFDPSEDDPPF